MSETPSLAPTHQHTPYYCEENVYLLLKSLVELKQTPIESAFAVFVSNPSRLNLLFHQTAATEDRQYVLWDYHVFAVVSQSNGKKEVWDLDSSLGPAVEFEEYVDETFRPSMYTTPGMQEILQLEEPRFRIVPVDLLLQHFASDRSHMLIPSSEVAGNPERSADRHEYTYPPPTWDALCSPAALERGIRHNLWSRYLDLRLPSEAAGDARQWQGWEDSGSIYGKVMTLQDFRDIDGWLAQLA